jgi:esterase/lipase
MQQVSCEDVAFLDWPVSNCRAICLLLHDFNTTPKRFTQLGEFLAANNIYSIAPELFTHDAKKINSKENDKSFCRVNKLISRINKQYNNIPIFLCGEGYGSILAMNYAQSKSDTIAGVIAISPYFKFSYAIIRRLNVFIDNIFRPNKSYFLPIKTTMVTKNANYLTDNSSIEGARCKYSAEFLTGFFRMKSAVMRNAKKNTKPIFIMLAKDDLICENSKTHKYYQSLQVEDKQINYYDEYHALTVPKDKEMVFTDVASWLKGRSASM